MARQEKILRSGLPERKIGVIPTIKYLHWMGGHGMGSAIFIFPDGVQGTASAPAGISMINSAVASSS